LKKQECENVNRLKRLVVSHAPNCKLKLLDVKSGNKRCQSLPSFCSRRAPFRASGVVSLLPAPEAAWGFEIGAEHGRVTEKPARF
jgi:hypothetical protein